MGFRSFEAFGTPSKGRIFVMNALRWAPKGFATWMSERDQSPGMVHIRKHREHVHEVATKLIEEKRQELKDGTPQRDVLSLLGRSCVAFMKLDIRCNIQFFSQGRFRPTARNTAER